MYGLSGQKIYFRHILKKTEVILSFVSLILYNVVWINFSYTWICVYRFFSTVQCLVFPQKNLRTSTLHLVRGRWYRICSMLFKRKKNLYGLKRRSYRVALIRVERDVMPSWNVVGAGLEVDVEILRVFFAPFGQWIVNVKGRQQEIFYLSSLCLAIRFPTNLDFS